MIQMLFNAAIYALVLLSCTSPSKKPIFDDGRLVIGAERMHLYLDDLRNKQVGLVVNQTSRVGDAHLVDVLIGEGIRVHQIYAPEHGFRGTADAGEKVVTAKDPETGIDIISLYGANKKPSAEMLSDIDILVFDIQDVGARFYTYISTLHYVMEAAAENGIPLIVLDRPNPNGNYVDGPVLDTTYRSFVGMHPVPVVHGMTIGEYARMINGEQWLERGLQCGLKVVPCLNYDHSMQYILPVKPSPNLPNALSIALYPSLCFFEGTTFSVGRGTDLQFQIIGHPQHPKTPFSFVPQSGPGAKYPKHENELCFGHDLSKTYPVRDRLDLSYLIQMYKVSEENDFQFFNDNGFFEKLAGTSSLRKMIEAGYSEEEIRYSWQEDLETFRNVRKKYLLYP